MLRLVARFGDAVRHQAVPSSGPIVLGAGKESDWVVPFPGISRTHARIEPSDGGALITDLGSKNGVVVGDRRVEEHRLQPGHRVLLGRALLSLEEVPTSDAMLALEIETGGGRGGQRPGVQFGETAPVSVLRLIRDLEGLRPGAGHELRRALLARVVEAVGADALWTFAPVEDDLFLRDCVGPLPAEAETAVLRARSLGGSEIAEVETAGGRLLLFAPADGDGSILAALFGTGTGSPGEWVRELLDHVARRLHAEPDGPGGTPSDAEPIRRAPLPEPHHLPGVLLAMVARAARQSGKRVRGVSRRAVRRLLDRPWPRGLDELEEVVERAVGLCPDGGALESPHLEAAEAAADPAGRRSDESFATLHERLEATERRAIEEALERAGGDPARAAELLGVDELSLRTRMERLGQG